MTIKTYKAPPPPYTPQDPREYSETAPLISKCPEYPRSSLRDGKVRKAEKFLTTCLTIAVALSTALIILSITAFLISLERNEQPKSEIKFMNFKVGIIGAGPAGIAAAQGVRKEVLAHTTKFKELNMDVQVEIVIYEEKARIGGRMVVEGLSIMGIEVEDIASGAFDRNLLGTIGGIMGENNKQENVVAQGEELGMGKVAFLDNNHIMVETYRPYATTPWKHYLSLILTYGTSIWKAPKIPTGTMKSFTSFLHTMAESNSSIDSVQEMIRIMSKQYSFVPFSIPASERLEKNGIGEKYIRDILAPQVRRHTGQSIEELSDLAISMALEREDMEFQEPSNSGVFQMMMENALKDSGSKLRLSSKVTKIRWEELIEGYENWIVQWEDVLDEEVPSNAEVIDKIIIAAPFNYSELLGDMEPKQQFTSRGNTHDIEYRPVYITFFLVPSLISSSFLETTLSDSLPAQLLPIIDPDQPKDSSFDSIIELSLLRSIAVNKGSVTYLYRLLSSDAISSSSLSTTLGLETNIIESWSQCKIRYAYPLMQPLLPKHIKGDFRLGKNIWTTNGAEGPLGSSVELAWTVGENVGRLVGRQIFEEGVEERLKENAKGLHESK